MGDDDEDDDVRGRTMMRTTWRERGREGRSVMLGDDDEDDDVRGRPCMLLGDRLSAPPVE